MVQGHISCCDYWGCVGVVSVKKLIAVFEILEHYTTKKAGLPPSGSAACFSSGPLILSLQDGYSCSHTPCKQEMVEWSQDSCLAPALRLFRTLGIFTSCGNISAEVARRVSVSSWMSGILQWEEQARTVTEKSQIEMLHSEKHSQPHEEITFLSLVILSSLLLWLNGNFFGVHLTTLLILWKEQR